MEKPFYNTTKQLIVCKFSCFDWLSQIACDSKEKKIILAFKFSAFIYQGLLIFLVISWSNRFETFATLANTFTIQQDCIYYIVSTSRIEANKWKPTWAYIVRLLFVISSNLFSKTVKFPSSSITDPYVKLLRVTLYLISNKEHLLVFN